MAKKNASEALALKKATLDELETVFSNLQAQEKFWSNEKSEYEDRLSEYRESNPDCGPEDWTVQSYERSIKSSVSHLAALEVIKDTLGALI